MADSGSGWTPVSSDGLPMPRLCTDRVLYVSEYEAQHGLPVILEKEMRCINSVGPSPHKVLHAGRPEQSM